MLRAQLCLVNWCAAAVCKMQGQPAGACSGFAEAVLAAPHAARAKGGLGDNLVSFVSSSQMVRVLLAAHGRALRL